ncbi:MAG: 4Fe-4S dicluster domain-containing protein [Acidobacteriaceae bacterium]
MAMAHAIDVALMEKIKKQGPGGTLDVSACFNCGNCTAVCPLAEDSSGFPRRVIRMAQVGMEKELLADEDIWRCYACGECTKTCPREADPMQFMAAARSYAISRYDVTGLARLMYRSWIGNVLVFLALSSFFYLLLLSHQGGMQMGSNGAIFSGYGSTQLFHYIPGEWVHVIGIALFSVIGISLAFGVISMAYRVIGKKNQAGERPPCPLAALPAAIWFAVMDALNHRRFRQCEKEEAPSDQPVYLRPWFVHGAIMWGFLAMLVATTVDYLFKPIGSPVPPWYPMRILGTLGGLFCLYGLGIAISRRVSAKETPYDKSSFSDWFFLLLLTATVLTGLLTEIIVYLPHPTVFGYMTFLAHIILAMDLLIMMPLTKFAHVIYRTLALALHQWAKAPAPQTATAAESNA